VPHHERIAGHRPAATNRHLRRLAAVMAAENALRLCQTPLLDGRGRCDARAIGVGEILVTTFKPYSAVCAHHLGTPADRRRDGYVTTNPHLSAQPEGSVYRRSWHHFGIRRLPRRLRAFPSAGLDECRKSSPQAAHLQCVFQHASVLIH